MREPFPGYPRPAVIDLVVATPVFLDLTFVGLEALPSLGEERFAAELLRSPGGGAITAVGAARLGLSVAVAAPLGDDVAGLVGEVGSVPLRESVFRGKLGRARASIGH